MKVSVDLAALERVDDLVGTLDKLIAAINANTAARAGFLPPKPEPCGGDCQLNGPRG